jgi:hypothetical protein
MAMSNRERIRKGLDLFSGTEASSLEGIEPIL